MNGVAIVKLTAAARQVRCYYYGDDHLYRQRIFSSFFSTAPAICAATAAPPASIFAACGSATASILQAQITSLATMCAVLLLHATPEQMGVLVALQALPFALFGLPVGVLLDRRSKHPIMLFSETMSGLALASVAVAYWCGALSMPWLYIVGFIIGLGFVTSAAAPNRFPDLPGGPRRLDRCAIKICCHRIGFAPDRPRPGDVLAQVLSAPVAILCTACGYLVSVFNLRAMSVRDPRPAPSSKHALRDIADSLLFVWREPLLRALAWGAGILALPVLRQHGLDGAVCHARHGHESWRAGHDADARWRRRAAERLHRQAIDAPLWRRPHHSDRTGVHLRLRLPTSAPLPALLLGSAAASAVAYAVLMFLF